MDNSLQKNDGEPVRPAGCTGEGKGRNERDKQQEVAGVGDGRGFSFSASNNRSAAPVEFLCVAVSLQASSFFLLPGLRLLGQDVLDCDTS